MMDHTWLMTVLVVISGPPASGKTTLGGEISRELGLPLLSRDDLKETLFDTLGTADREWSKKLGEVSWRLLYQVTETLIGAGQSVIAETNFTADPDGARLERIVAEHGCEVVHVHCTAEPGLLLERFAGRVERGQRHPGHVDEQTLPEVESMVASGWPRPRLPGRTYYIDTTNPGDIDRGVVVAGIRHALREFG